MLKKTPAPKNTAAKISALLTLLLGVFLFFMANAGLIALPWLAQLMGITLMTFAVYVASAYLLRRHTFIIESMSGAAENGEGAYDFIITEFRSNREMKVCHVSVKDIEFIREVNAENKKAVEKDRKGKARYTYDTQFAAARRIEIAIENGGERASMLITYDEELLRAFLAVGVRKI